MADVRSMLRQERAAREQSKPKKRAPVPTTAPIASRKRKANDDNEVADIRKKSKVEQTNDAPSEYVKAEPPVREEPAVDNTPAPEPEQHVAPAAPSVTPQVHLKQNDIDEDEWAAFQRDVATPPPEATNRPVVEVMSSNTVIAAAPLTAAELAAQARIEQSAQRGRRDAELEEEKEEAARHLEEEFDEMEELEERVRKLREKREALRKDREASQGVANTTTKVEDTAKIEDPESASNEESDEEWDDWRFRPA